MEWLTEKPTEPGFYFATDGSPALAIVARNLEGEEDFVCFSWQSKWGKSDDYIPTQLDLLDIKYWMKIEIPERPRMTEIKWVSV